MLKRLTAIIVLIIVVFSCFQAKARFPYAFSAVKINTLPALTRVSLFGMPVNASYVISAANITTGNFKDTPAANRPAPPNLYTVRIKLNNPTHATYTHAENPYNKSLVSIFQVDDSPKTIYNLMYPYLKGGTTAGGYVSPGVKSTDGAGNNLYWTISGACFVQDFSGNDLLAGNPNYISWSELATVTASGSGLQRGFDFTNHGFGGSEVLQKDRYKQIYLNNKAAFDHLGFQPEGLVVPDVQIGYRFGANDMGLDVTSQAGPEPLKDGKIPLSESASAQEIYAAVQSPYFIRRNHWQEVNDVSLVNEHKGYILAAFNKSQVKPGIYNWFSHGPGEAGTNNFAYYREVIDYMKSLAGDKVIGLSIDQYLGYQKVRYAAEHGAGKSSVLTPDGYLDVTFDMADLKNTVRHRLLSLLVSSDAQIESVTWSENIKAVSFNPATGLVNIQLNEITSVDPATLPVRPTIIAGSPVIASSNPNRITFQLDRAITQSIASAYTVTGNTITGIFEVPGSAGLSWAIQCANDFLSTDIVALTYKAEVGNATDLGNGKKMLTYSNLPVLNQSQKTQPEEASLAISIRRDSDNIQLATFNTIAEVKTYMNTFNFNTNISIVFNNSAAYALPAKWTLAYSNTNYTLTIKGKDGLESYPLIDAGGLTSDPFRVAMSHVRIKQLKIRSGKYTGDGTPFGDNYSGAIISQQAGTSDCQYTYLELDQGMRGIRIGGPNGTVSPNISNVLIDHVKLTELTGIAIQVGIQSNVGGEPESRTDASYTLNNVVISNITLRDTKNQQNIESSGAKYYGQILCRGINNLTLQNIDADQNQKQPYYIVSSKNILIDKVKATAFSLNTGTGFKAAIHIESSEIIKIQNSFVQASLESLYIFGSTGIKLYHNTFDVQQANLRTVVMSAVRKIEDIQGNLIAVKGDAAGRSAMGISFYRDAGYIPTIANDFVSEKNNLFVTASYIFEFQGIGAGNTNLTVANSATTFANYKTTYSRGENSLVAPASNLFFDDLEGVHGYLADGSAGRRFVLTQVAGITTDIANNARTLPTDAGAYNREGIVSANISSLSTSSGTLSPAFAPTVLAYTASVPHLTTNITITPSLADPSATMEVRSNGGSYTSLASGNPSGQFPLNTGPNIVEIKVTSSDGITINTYVITVTRATESFSINEISNSAISENSVFTGSAPSITGVPYGDLKYTLSGPDAIDFRIDPSTGILSMIERNHESPADANKDNVYEISVLATDQSNNSDQEDLTVTVLDINESATFTINAIGDTTINENTAYTGIVPAITGTPIGGTAPANFTIVPIPDTQYYTSQFNGGSSSIFKAQTNWITANKNALNIKYVIHLGDVVEQGDNGGNAIQWMRADTAMKSIEDPLTTQLPSGIPYAINVGNHDQSPAGNASGATNLYNQYFGSSRFAGRDYYGGHYGTDNDNNYQLFSAGGMDFIAINLEYDPVSNPQVLTWADDLLKAHPSRRAIVSSHYILNQNATFGAQGSAIYEKLKVNPNLFMMLSGHMNPNGEARRSDSFNGGIIQSLLSDYQDRPNGGNGWLRFMEFMPSENKIHVSTYSPTLNLFETDTNSQFVLDYPMTVGVHPNSLVYTLSGNDASDFAINTSTGLVTMVARNYEGTADANADNVYEVTITATDADGNTDSEDIKITVADVVEQAVFTIDAITNVSLVENYPYTSGVPAITGTPIGNLIYSLAGSDASDFTINPSTGIVSMVPRAFAQPVDANADNIYELTLVATDEDGNNTSRSYTVRITKFYPFPYAETFKNSTASGLIFEGSPTPASLTGGNIDINGSGYLRLTSNANNQTAFARNITSFPSDEGMSISFDYYTHGGSGADGLSFFLYDATANPFVIGGFGGSLGYAQNNTLPGVSKAFLGLGIDEFGNFSNPTAARQGGPGQRSSSVILRGDGNGVNGPLNYEYLTSIQTSDAAAMSAVGAGNAFQIAGGVNGRTSAGLNPSMPGYRRAKLNLKPNDLGTGYKIDVWITEGNSGGGTVHHVIKNYMYIPSSAIPAMLNYGFSAGTGGQNNFHEIRNLEIRLPENIVSAPVVTDIAKSGSENGTIFFSSEDFSSKFTATGGNALSKVKILSLPAHGSLKLNSAIVAIGQEIPVGSLPFLSFVSSLDYHGSDSFQWNGSDGSVYAVSGAYVNLNIIAAPIFPYSESFKNPTAAGMLYGGTPLQALLTGGNLDANAAGYLRLTTNAINQKGFARNTKSFPTLNGLSISFEYYTYGGNGADGISFFLYDASANPFVIGGFGGSLGYAQNAGAPGVGKAYLGVGLDEFGNFSNPTAARQGGPGQRPSAVTLRGDGNGSTAIASNYEYLTSLQTSNVGAMNAAGAGTAFQVAGGINGRTAGAGGLTHLNPGYRKAKIELKPNGSGTGFIISVWITEGNASGGVVHPAVSNYSYIGSTMPSQLSYGFAGSTGGSTNFHEVRNLSITLPESFQAPTLMTAFDKNRNLTEKSSSVLNNTVIDKNEISPTNLFSPNGDGKNDTWVVRNIQYYPKNSLKIFNKKGKEVYTKSGYNNDWDGTFNGSQLEEDTYYYILDLGREGNQLKGYISIVR